VTLLDPASDLGGVAQETIPPERLPLTLLHREIGDVLAASGRVNRRGARLGPSLTLDHLHAEGFHATLIAIGLSVSQPLPGARRPDAGVEGALEFLARVKRGDRVEGKVLVLGGGNTAVDAAVSAKRAGASDVFIVYRRSFAEMPAWPEERDQAMRAGVHFLILTLPLKYAVAGDGRLVGVEVIRTHLGAPGPDGRRRPAPIPGSEHLLPADVVVEAIGQRLSDEVRQALTGIELTKDGLVCTKEGSLATSRAGVYAAGDIVNGGATVVDAVAQGARAAREIDAWLRGAD
jgi:NADPH-dependent glutamate synthase beta subunit-like oxidoreductase